jgi:hypothetical protein
MNLALGHRDASLFPGHGARPVAGVMAMSQSDGSNVSTSALTLM